ncbi:MAG: hypothetical protein ACRCU5_06365 [Rhizobiaceae bacterium]
MFFDEPTPKRPGLRPKLRLAGEEDARDADAPSNAVLSARERLEKARFDKNNTPSLLDHIDAITRANEEALAALEDGKAGEPTTAPKDETITAHPADNAQTEQAAWTPDHGGNAPLIHPVYVFNAVKRWRSLIAATTILGGLVGVGLAMATPKLYYSSTGILLDPRPYRVLERDINPDVFLSDAALAIVDSQVNVIRSPTVMDKVVTKLVLENNPEFNGTKQGLLSPFTSFFGIMSGETSAVTNLSNAIRNLNAKTFAERQQGTFVINIGAYSEDAEMAARIANTMVEVYLAERTNSRTGTADRTSGSMEARLPELKKQVETAEMKAARFKSENDLFDPQGRLINDEVILRLNDQLSAARSDTIRLNSRADSAKAVTVDGLLAGGLPEEINSNALNTLRGQFVAVQQRYEGLQAKLGPMHPDLKQASKESASLRTAIDGEIKRIRSSIQTELRRAVQTEQALAGRLAEMKASLAASGDALVQLREIEREAASARSVYEQFLLRAQETSEQGAVDSTNVEQTFLATPSLEATGTSRKLIAIGGLIGGFLLGLGLAIAAGIWDALKVRFAASLGTSGAPNSPSSGPSKRSIRGMFQPADSAAGSSFASPRDWSKQAAVAQANPAPATAGIMQEPAPLSSVMLQPAPAYAQPQPVFMPQPWFAPQPVMMQQPMWMPQPQFIPVAQPVMPQPVAPEIPPQPAPAIQSAPTPIPQVAKLPQNPQLTDIQESLAGMKAELLSLARQRRHG